MKRIDASAHLEMTTAQRGIQDGWDNRANTHQCSVSETPTSLYGVACEPLVEGAVGSTCASVKSSHSSDSSGMNSRQYPQSATACPNRAPNQPKSKPPRRKPAPAPAN